MKKRKFFSQNLYLFLCGLLFVPGLAAAANESNTGNYCPSPSILRIVAEEVTASLDLALQSQALQGSNHRLHKISTLQSAGTILQLAASRGAAARITVLVDAILQEKASENYKQMLVWFPLLKTAIQVLPEDATVAQANEAIARAEAIMGGSETGNPLQNLRQAQHLLACDGLDIPLQKAMTAQGALLGQLQKRSPVSSKAYTRLVDLLRAALTYVLDQSNTE